MMERKVTERDLRHPDFARGEPDEYEFRSDGKIVRKDRWEMAVQRIRELVGIPARAEWEIQDIIKRVDDIVNHLAIPEWQYQDEDE